MTRDFKGIWIPKEIWLDNNMTIMEKVFLVEIDSLDNELGCFASNQYFADFFGLSKNRCSEIIKSLESKGYLTIKYEKDPGKKSIKKRTVKVFGKPTTPIRKIDYPYSENTEDNNTVFNNTNIYGDKPQTPKKKKAFKPPTVEEVAAYCRERNNGIDAETFVAHYEATDWKRGKSEIKIKNWKACVVTWEKRNNNQSSPKQQTIEQILSGQRSLN